MTVSRNAGVVSYCIGLTILSAAGTGKTESTHGHGIVDFEKLIRESLGNHYLQGKTKDSVVGDLTVFQIVPQMIIFYERFNKMKELTIPD